MSRSTSSSGSFLSATTSQVIHHGVLHLMVTRVIEITLGFSARRLSESASALVASSSRRSASVSAGLLRGSGASCRHFCVTFRSQVWALLVRKSNAFVLTRATGTVGIRHPRIIRISDDAFRLSHTRRFHSSRCRHR